MSGEDLGADWDLKSDFRLTANPKFPWIIAPQLYQGVIVNAITMTDTTPKARIPSKISPV